MYKINMNRMSDEFYRCWLSAGEHLDNQIPGGIPFWLRVHPYPPFLEHFSFRLGNQLFFVRVYDVDNNITGPGSLEGLFVRASESKGHACLLPMMKNVQGDRWEPASSGWGLLNAKTMRPINPVALVNDDAVVMTPWEIQDAAVQFVRYYLEQQGYDLISWQGDPDLDPSIWFIGDSKGPEWVVVRPAIYPVEKVERPDNWQEIIEASAELSRIGHFVSVSLASTEQPFESPDENPIPLWRGQALQVNFEELDKW